MEYRLLEKTEMWISPVGLSGADLSECAIVVGRVLGLKPEEIMVTDALEDRLTLDILVPTVEDDQIISREKAILEALVSVSGVKLSAETTVHSKGILGLISLDERTGEEVLQRSRSMSAKIAERIKKRAMVLATGSEVMEGQIKDSNTPFLIDALAAAGYEADRGPVLLDDLSMISQAFRSAGENAYGLVISTGGIGAEGKDRTVEALTTLDPDAATPYVLKFHKGHGRHQKEGVRLGVGRWENTTIVCLPGPHDEVELLWPILKQGLLENQDKRTLAESLVTVLRKKFLSRSGHDSTITEEQFENAVIDRREGRF
jgi:molybdenum cofactor synthesis domain-containing protein